MRVIIIEPPQAGIEDEKISHYDNAVDGTFVVTAKEYQFQVNSETGIQDRSFQKWDGITGINAEVVP